MIRDGIDPSQAKKAQKESASGADSFETIAREWFSKLSPAWTPSHGGLLFDCYSQALYTERSSPMIPPWIYPVTQSFKRNLQDQLPLTPWMNQGACAAYWVTPVFIRSLAAHLPAPSTFVPPYSTVAFGHGHA